MKRLDCCFTRGALRGNIDKISTYPSIRPSVYLSIRPSSPTPLSNGVLLTVTGLLTGQRGARDYRRTQILVRQMWRGLLAVNRLNTPLWHAWNPCGCTYTEKKSSILKTSPTTSTCRHAQSLLYFSVSLGTRIAVSELILITPLTFKREGKMLLN